MKFLATNFHFKYGLPSVLSDSLHSLISHHLHTPPLCCSSSSVPLSPVVSLFTPPDQRLAPSSCAPRLTVRGATRRRSCRCGASWRRSVTMATTTTWCSTAPRLRCCWRALRLEASVVPCECVSVCMRACVCACVYVYVNSPSLSSLADPKLFMSYLDFFKLC